MQARTIGYSEPNLKPFFNKSYAKSITLIHEPKERNT